MSRPDRDERTARLQAAAKRKSQDTAARAHRAVIALENRRQAVNFNTVAAEAAVSKDFLYNNTQLRSLIMQKRSGQPGARIPATERTSEASALVKLAVATEALRRIRQENAQLRRENSILRDEVLAPGRTPQEETRRGLIPAGRPGAR